MTLESDVNLTSNGRQMSAGSNIEKKKERKKAKETHETNDLIFTQSEVSLICTPHMVRSMKNTRSKSRLDYDV